jgi:site-specific DNA-methyltransferase (adenine-specific)
MNLGPYEPNNIYCGECAEMMSHLPDACIDLTVTSPPYDNLRSYNGYTFDFFAIARQLIRVTKPGGVIVWVVADQTVNGSETGTSFKQALYFMAKGMRLHDTMVYHTGSQGAKGSNLAYWQAWEYMFVFSKGKPKTVNRIKDHKNIYAGTRNTSTRRRKDGSRQNERFMTPDMSVRANVWYYPTGKGVSNKSALAFEHDAPFPDNLARDHILSWSNKGDLVFDPFVGSGTTAQMAMQNGRNYLGFDISPEYVELARKRVAYANPPLLVFG